MFCFKIQWANCSYLNKGEAAPIPEPNFDSLFSHEKEMCELSLWTQVICYYQFKLKFLSNWFGFKKLVDCLVLIHVLS